MSTNNDQKNGDKDKAQNDARLMQALQAWMVVRLTEELKLNPADFDATLPFMSYGLDSIVAFALTGELADLLGQELPTTLFWDFPRIEALASHLADEIKDGGAADSVLVKINHALSPVESSMVADLVEGIDEDHIVPSQEETKINSRLLTLQSGHNGKSIFCFPYLGGFRSEYFHFAKIARLLGTDYSFYGLRTPVEDAAAEDDLTIENIAADCLGEIQAVQPHGPYSFIGECAGGLVAFETARQLQDLGETVALLALFDIPARSYAQRVRRRLAAQLRNSFRFDSRPWLWDYLLSRSAFHLKASDQLAPFQKLGYFFKKAGQAPSLISYGFRRERVNSAQGSVGALETPASTLQRAEQRYYRALMRYQFRPRYHGRITLLVNEQWHAANPTLGWSRFAGGGLDVYKIPGNHDTCIPDNIPLVAELLRECLEKVATEPK
jgi:thioesterase domain-containing protein/acyl carrier protein